MQALKDEVLHFQKFGQVLLAGDINARTGNERDYILPDKFEGNGEQNYFKTLPERNSEDKRDSDNRGKELLETCKALNLVLNNGRKPGDMYGKYTSIQWNRCSVVDYIISDYEIFQDISTPRVGPYNPWLSDQCALHFTIFHVIKRFLVSTIKVKYWSKRPNSFHGVKSAEKVF